MYSTAQYLLSGITSISTGTIQVLGMDKFTITLHASSFGSNVATGTFNIDGRIDSTAPYVNIFTQGINNNTGIATQFDGPWESLRATINPLTTGTYTVVSRHS